MIGRIISIDFLGFYNRSEMLRNLITNNIESVITSSSYPVLSSLQNNRDAFLGLTIKTLKFAFLIVGLSLALLFSLAEPLVEFLLGPKWIYSAEILRYLTLAGLTMPLSSIMINTISVSGRSDLYLKLQAYYSVYVLITLFFAYFFGVNYFLYSLVASSLISYVHTTLVFRKIYDYSLYDQLKDLKNKLFIILLTIVSLSVLRFFLKDLTAFTNLIILISSFIILILLYLKIAKDKEITSIYNSLISICKSRIN
jgi:O-antigen/teichoic acid export membrane protein